MLPKAKMPSTKQAEKYGLRLEISIHAPRGGATRLRPPGLLPAYISIHAPRGGSDPLQRSFRPSCRRFNPRSPWGERLGRHNQSQYQVCEFQSTLPVGGATPQGLNDTKQGLFQSTLPVGGATSFGRSFCCCGQVSIHAPRGGSDNRSVAFHSPPTDFNPRSPWGERRLGASFLALSLIFQSTLPVGGATIFFPGDRMTFHISIHAPRGGSDVNKSTTN